MFKKNQLTYLIITITIICFNIIILIFPDLIVTATKNALLLWFNRVIPSLYPFIILNNVLKEVNGFKFLGIITKPFSKLLFKHSGNGSVAFISGITSGYPLGGLVTANLLEEKLISQNEANYFIMFTNNAGPLFVIGTIGITMFSNAKIGYFLLLNHIISSLFLGVLLSFFKKKQDKNLSCTKKNMLYWNKKNNNILQSINSSIVNSNETILIIGGFIMFYSIIIGILDATNILSFITKILVSNLPLNELQAKAIICGFFEMTNGINMLTKNISNLQLDLAIINAILSFGGLSIHGQTLTGILKTKIKVSNYFIGKFFHTILCSAMTYITYDFVNFQNAIPTFSTNTLPLNYNNSYIFYFYIIFFILILTSFIIKK